jgi:hypothetical protein
MLCCDDMNAMLIDRSHRLCLSSIVPYVSPSKISNPSARSILRVSETNGLWKLAGAQQYHVERLDSKEKPICTKAKERLPIGTFEQRKNKAVSTLAIEEHYRRQYTKRLLPCERQALSSARRPWVVVQKTTIHRPRTTNKIIIRIIQPSARIVDKPVRKSWR